MLCWDAGNVFFDASRLLANVFMCLPSVHCPTQLPRVVQIPQPKQPVEFDQVSGWSTCWPCMYGAH